jgi:adenylyltransferase/sulfurtransferase
MSLENSNFFARQEEIPWFSQERIKNLTVSILGIGGIGCNLAILLTRLGVKKIHLIDYDIVEASNLNRQTLFSKKDIGKSKTISAKNTLDNLDNLNSEIVNHDYDLFEDWQKTVEIIKESDYVLNGLDLPEIKRTLIGIACQKLGIPMIYSGTDPHSGYSGMVLFQASKEDKPCYECLQAILCTVEKEDLIEKYSQNHILSFETIIWKELEKEDYQRLEGGATTVITAMMASILAVNILIQSVHDQQCPHRIIFDLFSNNIENFFLETREDCVVCGGG